jgi:hypothetical protein
MFIVPLTVAPFAGDVIDTVGAVVSDDVTVNVPEPLSPTSAKSPSAFLSTHAK